MIGKLNFQSVSGSLPRAGPCGNLMKHEAVDGDGTRDVPGWGLEDGQRGYVFGCPAMSAHSRHNRYSTKAERKPGLKRRVLQIDNRLSSTIRESYVNSNVYASEDCEEKVQKYIVALKALLVIGAV
jgi:hypothetical protein